MWKASTYITPTLRWCAHITPVLPQVVIFVKSVQRCIALAQLLVEQNFPAIAIHRGMPQEERWVGGRRACAHTCPSVRPSICLSPVGGVERRESQFSHLLSQRLSRYQQFKDFQRRILVATNLFGRGMDIERVNIAFNYDMPEDSDTYLHRVSCPPSPRFLCVRARAVHLCLPREACSFPLFLPGGQSGPLWYQGLGHHICVRRERCQDPQ